MVEKLKKGIAWLITKAQWAIKILQILITILQTIYDELNEWLEELKP